MVTDQAPNGLLDFALKERKLFNQNPVFKLFSMNPKDDARWEEAVWDVGECFVEEP